MLGLTMKQGPSKKRRMPLGVESTRYSLVKGERIVRFVLTTWLRDFNLRESEVYLYKSFLYQTLLDFRCGMRETSW